MPTPDQLAARFMAEVDNANGPAVARLVAHLDAALPALREDAERAALRVQTLRAAGANADAAVFAAQRARAIADQVEAEITTQIGRAYPAMRTEQDRAAMRAADDARDLVGASLPEGLGVVPPDMWTRPPLESVRALAGGLGDDSPLAERLAAVGPGVAREVRQELITGMLAGRSPRDVGRMVARASGLARDRADTIARHETIKAYRAGSLATYQANRALVPRYRRSAAEQERTCILCLALDGKEYDTGELMHVHVLDRCAMIPIVAGSEPAAVGQGGQAYFAGLPAADQLRILGPARFAQYQEHGDLTRFVDEHDDPTWGPALRLRRVGSPGPSIPLRLPGRLPDLPDGLGGPRAQSADQIMRAVAGDVRAVKRLDREAAAADKAYLKARKARDKAADARRNATGISYDERTRLRDAENAARNASQAAYEAARTARAAAEAARQSLRARLTAALEQEPSRARITVTADTPDDLAAFQHGIDRWRRLIGRGHPIEQDQGVSIVPYNRQVHGGDDLSGRSYYQQAQRQVVAFARSHDGYGRGGMNSTDTMIAHELTHYFEHNDPVVRRRVAEYYAERTFNGGGRQHLGEGYADEEMAIFDKFIDPYMGKDYTRGGAGRTIRSFDDWVDVQENGSHELLTMALQHLYAQPEHLLIGDPGLFRFTVDLLGRRR